MHHEGSSHHEHHHHAMNGPEEQPEDYEGSANDPTHNPNEAVTEAQHHVHHEGSGEEITETTTMSTTGPAMQTYVFNPKPRIRTKERHKNYLTSTPPAPPVKPKKESLILN